MSTFMRWRAIFARRSTFTKTWSCSLQGIESFKPNPINIHNLRPKHYQPPRLPPRPRRRGKKEVHQLQHLPVPQVALTDSDEEFRKTFQLQFAKTRLPPKAQRSLPPSLHLTGEPRTLILLLLFLAACALYFSWHQRTSLRLSIVQYMVSHVYQQSRPHHISYHCKTGTKKLVSSIYAIVVLSSDLISLNMIMKFSTNWVIWSYSFNDDFPKDVKVDNNDAS